MASPTLALTALDMRVLDFLITDSPSGKRKRATLTSYLTKIARLGGYLARAKDPPPGNAVMWRGVTRLTDIELGVVIGAQLVGN
ncbi:MAG: IS4 family transposase, partial [Bryobacteraceae bacterium]